MSKSNLPYPPIRGKPQPPYKLGKNDKIELTMPNGRKKIMKNVCIDKMEITQVAPCQPYSTRKHVQSSRTEVTCKLLRAAKAKSYGKSYRPLHPNTIFNIYTEIEDDSGNKVSLHVENAKVVAQFIEPNGLETLTLIATKAVIGEGAEKRVVREPFVFR